MLLRGHLHVLRVDELAKLVEFPKITLSVDLLQVIIGVKLPGFLSVELFAQVLVLLLQGF